VHNIFIAIINEAFNSLKANPPKRYEDLESDEDFDSSQPSSISPRTSNNLKKKLSLKQAESEEMSNSYLRTKEENCIS
jgi:hypothetical protein